MIDINATAIPWFIVKGLKLSSPKSKNRTLQFIITPKAEGTLLWWLGCQKGWALYHSENSVWSPWMRAIHEDGPCLQTESDVPLTTQQLDAWEPETSKAEHKPLVHIYHFQQEVKSLCCSLAGAVKVAEVAWVVQKYFVAASYRQNI